MLSGFVGHRLLPDVVPPPAAPPDWGAAALAPLLETLEARLAERPFLAGEALTIADLCVAGMTTYFRAAAFPFAAHPRIAGWHARIEAVPAWRETEDPLWRAP